MHFTGTSRLLTLIACAVVSGCGEGLAPISPSNPVAEISIIFQSQAAISLEATLNGGTFRRSRSASFSEALRVGLAPGTYTLSGTFSPGAEANDGFKVTFFSLPGAGGVVSGSIRDVNGPGPQVSDCNVTYLAAGGAQNFSMQFDVSSTPDDAIVCP